MAGVCEGLVRFGRGWQGLVRFSKGVVKFGQGWYEFGKVWEGVGKDLLRFVEGLVKI